LKKGQKGAAREPGGLLYRLIRRHVIQAAAIYVAVAWGALEILITLQEKLGWPEVISVWATRLFVVGFPVAVILAWRRDLESAIARFGLVGLAFVAAGVALWLTLSTDPVHRAPSARLPPVSEAIATIAVLPFENGTGDPAHDYLASGFTGELIGRLSKHPDLAVIQEESIGAPLLASLIPAAKAATLNADYLVQGRVVREDKFIEVNASLQDLDGQVLWSEILREPYSAENILAMQRRISGEVSRLLGTTLDAPAYCGETTDIDAMELYYRGRMKVGTRITESMEEGMELLKQAVKTDPYFGRGWAQLGAAQLVLSGRMRDPVEGDRERAGMLWSMMQTSFRRALDICPTIGGAYKVMVPPYEGIDNASIDQEMQFRDSLAMDPNDASLLRQYAIHLMQHGMNAEAVEVMRRAYDNEPLLAMIPFQLAHTLNRLGRCDEALALAADAEELGGQPKVAIESGCAWLRKDRDGLIEAGHRFVEVGMGFPFKAIEMSVEEFTEARLDADSPLRSVMAQRMRALWEENPDPEKNMHIYWIVATATDIGDLDLVFEILDTIADENGFRGYTIAWSPLFAAKEESSRLRADPRFVEMLKKTSYPEYWRAYGWPTGCAPAGDAFRCF
jgi:serine/threonine-protein kinase